MMHGHVNVKEEEEESAHTERFLISVLRTAAVMECHNRCRLSMP